jgi:hypothetical protein
MSCYLDLSALHVYKLGLLTVPKLSSISTYLGYAVSLSTFVFGTIIVSGIAFQYVPAKLRITFGVVLMLWGIYRFVFTWIHVRQHNENDEEE